MADIGYLIAWTVVGLVALALVVYLAAKVVEHRNPPIGSFLELDGTRIHYFERGTGPAVVFLHGNATLLQDFTLSEAFSSAAKQSRAIAFDRPGFGYSSRPRARNWNASEQANVIAAALRRLNCGPATIVGHSWGTLVAVALAEQHPALVRSLVVLSGYFFPAPRFDAALAGVGATPILGDILRYTVTPLFGLFMLPLTVRAMFAPCAIEPRFEQNFPRLMMLRPWQLRASLGDGAMMLQSAAVLRQGYAALQVPVFIAAGDADRIVEPWHSKQLGREVRTSEVRIIPGIGHMVQHSAPNEVAAMVAKAA